LYLVAFHVPIVGLALIVPLLGLPLLLLPVHLIWLELVVHPVSALIFEAKPAPNDLMRRPPRQPNAPLLDRGPLAWSVISGLVMTVAATLLFFSYQSHGIAYARGVALATLIVSSLLLVFAELAGDAPWWKMSLPRPRRFWPIMTIIALSVVAATSIVPFAGVLR